MPGHPSGELVIAIRNSLTALLLATCDAAVCTGGERTQNIVKGACVAMMGSAPVMVH